MKLAIKIIRWLSVVGAMALTDTAALAQSGNEVVGENAAPAITTGDHNVVVGSDAAIPLSVGSNNVVLGHGSAEEADPNNAVLIGEDTGRVLESTATGNTIIGRLSGTSTTFGQDNTFLGENAGEDNTTGYSNTFIGEDAGENNTTGYQNVFIGENVSYRPRTSFRNIFLGRNIGISPENAWGNVGVGYEALDFLDYDAVRNTAIGLGAHHNGSNAVATTMVGSWAGNANRDADFGVMIGVMAGQSNGEDVSTAISNTFVGAAAGYTNERGKDNVVVGAFAGSGTWNQADLVETNFQNIDEEFVTAVVPTDGNARAFRRTVLGALSRGSQNETIAIGYDSQSLIAGGIAFGNNSRATHTNSMAIGQGTVSQAENTLVLGNASLVSINPDADGVTALGSATERFAAVHAQSFVARADSGASAAVELNADAGTDYDDRWQMRADDGGALSFASYATGSFEDRFSATSSGNVTIADKVDVFSDERLKQDIASIDRAMNLLGAIKGRSYEWRPELHRESGRQYGLIAQEVEAVIPEIVNLNGDTGIRSVNYQALVPVLINGIKEQQASIENQDATLQARAETIAHNQSLIEQQQQAIQQMQAQLREQQNLLEQITEVEGPASQTANYFPSE